MINVNIYFNRGSSTSFNIEDADIENMKNKQWWRDECENKLLDLSKQLQQTIEKKSDYFLYEHKSISESIQFESRLLQAFYTGFDQQMIIIEDVSNDHQLYGATSSYSLFMNEFEFRESILDFISSTFYYNNDIKNNDYIKVITNPNSRDGLNPFIMKKLLSFNHNNISVLLNKDKIEPFRNQVSELISATNKISVNEKIVKDHYVITKINGYSPKSELLNDKFGIHVKFNNSDTKLYFEHNFGINTLIMIEWSRDFSIAINGTIGDFFHILLQFLHGDEKIDLPMYELLDEDNKTKLSNYIYIKTML